MWYEEKRREEKGPISTHRATHSLSPSLTSQQPTNKIHLFSTHPNSTEPSNAIYVTPYENNIFNDLKLTAYNVSVAKSVMLGIVEDERCKMVWNGSTLDNGVLPIGKFVDYMVFETWMMRDEGSDNLHNDAGIRKMKKRENDEENEDEKDEEDDIEIGKRGRLCLAHRRERNL